MISILVRGLSCTTRKSLLAQVSPSGLLQRMRCSRVLLICGAQEGDFLRIHSNQTTFAVQYFLARNTLPSSISINSLICMGKTAAMHPAVDSMMITPGSWEDSSSLV